MTSLQPEAGKLAENVMHFARLLRGAGLPVGPDRVIDALSALQFAGVERRDDFYWTLASVFLARRDQFDLYDQAFRVFWRDPRDAARVRHLPEVRGRIPRHNREPELSARLTQALAAQHQASPAAPAADRIEFDASFTFSARESLRTLDFESMTNEELAAARETCASAASTSRWRNCRVTLVSRVPKVNALTRSQSRAIAWRKCRNMRV